MFPTRKAVVTSFTGSTTATGVSYTAQTMQLYVDGSCFGDDMGYSAEEKCVDLKAGLNTTFAAFVVFLLSLHLG